MEEASGKVQKTSTHGSSVGVDVATVERDCVTQDIDAASPLPQQQSTSVKASAPSGQWGGFMKTSTYLGLVVVDIAAVDCDCAIVDVDATPGLPIKGST